MEKEKITDFSGKASAEMREAPAGKYSVRAEFKTRSGEVYGLNFDRPISLEEGEDIAVLRKKVMSAASSVGLHNFGMDIYVGRYPDGHPVKFILRHESGQETEFIRSFDGRGYPIEEKQP